MGTEYKLDFTSTDLFPLFIDYDFGKRRSRGLTTKMDYFSNGQLDKIASNLDGKEVIYVRKQFFIFKQGFFIYDYKLANNSIFKVFDQLNTSRGITEFFFLRSSVDVPSKLYENSKYKITMVSFIELSSAV